MEIDKAREYITHKLNGELSKEELAELEAFVTEQPEFREEIKAMEEVWQRLDVLKHETSSAPPMRSDLRDALAGGSSRSRSRRNRYLSWLALPRRFSSLSGPLSIGAHCPQRDQESHLSPGMIEAALSLQPTGSYLNMLRISPARTFQK